MTVSPADLCRTDHCVPVYTCFRRDAARIRGVVRKEGIEPEICTSLAQFTGALGEETAVAVVGAEVLDSEALDRLSAIAVNQAAWSDLAFLIVCTAQDGLTERTRWTERLGNVVVVERPLHSAPLLTALRSALRARRRQYEVRQAHARLRETLDQAVRDREHLRLAQEVGQIGSFEWDVAGGRIYWSDELHRIYGLAPGTFEGTREGWGRLIHPEDLAMFEDAIHEGGVRTWEFRIRHSDGAERWLYARAHVLVENGVPVRILGVNMDITDRKKAGADLSAALRREHAAVQRSREFETVLARIADSNIIGILIADTERILEANDAFLQMVGYGQEELASGAIRWREMTPPEFSGADNRGLAELLATGKCTPFEKEYFRKDGSRLPILLGAAILTREPLRWVCFVLDLTERRRVEAALRESQKLESTGVLAAGIAHDFNNLLTSVLGYASLVEGDLPREHPAVPMMGLIRESAEKAASLTRQLLAYAGKGRFVIEPIDLGLLVQQCRNFMRAAIPKRIDLRLDVHRPLPQITGDRSQFEQVLINLVTNAAEAIGNRNGGSILVTTRASGPDSVMLRVSDNGVGMDEATRARIFDPFFTTKFPGRGLGMAAVSGIVRSSNGSIHVESEPGRGTTVTLLLPAAVEPVAGNDGLGGGRTVLLVDDEESIRRLARQILERYDFRVLEAGNGRAAMEIFARQETDIHLVVLDLTMPGVSGTEVHTALRARRPDVPILIITGLGQRDAERQCANLKCSRILYKPFTAEKFVDSVRSVLDGDPS